MKTLKCVYTKVESKNPELLWRAGFKWKKLLHTWVQGRFFIHYTHGRNMQ